MGKFNSRMVGMDGKRSHVSLKNPQKQSETPKEFMIGSTYLGAFVRSAYFKILINECSLMLLKLFSFQTRSHAKRVV